MLIGGGDMPPCEIMSGGSYSRRFGEIWMADSACER